MGESREQWPEGLAIEAVRFARHTAKLDEIVAFYRDGVGLPVIGSFRDHDGYSGVMLGLPGSTYHLEFTTDGAETASTPSADDLLVFYFSSGSSLEAVAARLDATAERTSPTNPYWQTKENTITFLDPDGWRVVLVHPRDA